MYVVLQKKMSNQRSNSHFGDNHGLGVSIREFLSY